MFNQEMCDCWHIMCCFICGFIWRVFLDNIMLLKILTLVYLRKFHFKLQARLINNIKIKLHLKSSVENMGLVAILTQMYIILKQSKLEFTI